MEILETILKNDLPQEFTGLYEHKHMSNTMSNRFESIDENKSRWIADVEYTRFSGLIPKLLASLFPGMFKKQTQKWLSQFKVFAENKK